MDEQYRLARLAGLETAVREMMQGDNEAAKQWWQTPIAIFGHESPLVHAATDVGLHEVEDLIGRIRHGVFS